MCKSPPEISTSWSSETSTPKDIETKSGSNTDLKPILINIDGKTYNVTNFASKHPGGEEILQATSELGHKYDATDLFHSMHPPYVAAKYLKTYLVVEDSKENKISIDEATKEYRKLHTALLAGGMYEPTKYSLFLVMFRIFSFLAVSALATFLRSSNTYTWTWHIVGSISLGLFWQQSLLFAHDIMHRSVVTPTTMNGMQERNKAMQMLGLIFGGVFGGVGPFWWTDDHSMHHMFTNVVDLDPSAGSDPVLFCDPKMYKPSFISSIFLRLQTILYVPLCLFVGRPNLHLISVILSKRKLLDGISVMLYFTWTTLWYKSIPVASNTERWVYILISNLVCSILHLQLNLNHYPTGMYTKQEYQKMTFVEYQLRTTMNVRSNAFTDWFHGGLHMQIEHHLFPLLPRERLGYISDKCRYIAKLSGIPYVEQGFWEANLSTIHVLSSTTQTILTTPDKLD